MSKKHPRFFRWFLKRTDIMKGPNDAKLDNDIEQLEFYLKGFWPLFKSIFRRKIWRFICYWGWLRFIYRIFIFCFLVSSTYYVTVHYIKPFVSPTSKVIEVKEIYRRNLKSWEEFKLVVGKRESNNNWDTIKGQYHGYFQFGDEAFKACQKTGMNINWWGKDSFLKDSDLQTVYFKALLRLNKKDLKDIINKYDMRDQSFINGTPTESGILMAAHLRGTMAVRMFFVTKGRINSVDGNGTSVKDYIEEFSGYKLDI
jgi:hypothetical protein